MAQNILNSLGGGSGIDTISLVENLVAAERAPQETQLDSKERTLETQISGYGALRSAMSGIQDSVNLLSDDDTFSARNVTFQDTDLVAPTNVDAGAATGDFTLNVTSLAAAHSLNATGFSDPDAVVGNGTLTFTFGDWAGDHSSFTASANQATTTLTIDSSNNTLNGLRDAINAEDFGVQASVIEIDGTYSLQLTSDSGANNEMQIQVSEGAPAGLSALSFDTGNFALNEGVKGKDAAFTVNGLAVTRSSNEIDDVIQGLEFTLNGISVDANDTTTISVSADNSFGEQVIRDFVDAYNRFLEQVKTLTTPSDVDEEAEDQTPGSLARDPSARSMVNQVRSLISQNITGLDGNYTALATVGIQTTLTGDLEINESLFQDALDNNYAALTSLFTGSSSSTDARLDILRTTGVTQPGSYEVVVTTDPAKGYLAGGGVSVTDAADLGLDTATGVFSGGLDTSLGDYSFQIEVDGTLSEVITLSGNYADTDALIADMQARINGDENLSGVAAAVDIAYDTATGSFTTTSRTYGATSTVEFSNISADMDRLAFGGGATSAALTGTAVTTATGVLTTTGAIADSGVTDMGTQGGLTTTGTISGAAATNLVDGAPGADTYSTPLDLSGGGYDFSLLVDGAETATVNLLGNAYADTDELVADMQSQINASITGGASVIVSYDSSADKFTFTSGSGGAASNVNVTAIGVNAGQLGISVENGTAGVDNETFVTQLDTTAVAGEYEMTVNIDGTDIDIDLSTIDVGHGVGIYQTANEIQGALDTAVAAAVPGASVSYDTVNNRFTVTSGSSGVGSTVDITAIGAGMSDLGFAIESGVDTFVGGLDTTGMSFTLTSDSGADNITLSGTYDTPEEIKDALQAAVVLSGVTVGYDAESNTFSFTAASLGATSSVAISAATGVGVLGISDDSDTGRDALASVTGIDVEGTIDGVSAFGSGNILLPQLGSPLTGLTLEVAAGVTSATITIARGFGQEVNNILDTFLANNGLIATRESRINDQLEDIETDRTDLDRQMEARTLQLQAQFLAMERIIRSLNATSGQLDGLIDRLPFTASKS